MIFSKYFESATAGMDIRLNRNAIIMFIDNNCFLLEFYKYIIFLGLNYDKIYLILSNYAKLVTLKPIYNV